MIVLRDRHLVVHIDPDWGAQVVHLGRTDDENVLFHGGDWSTPLPASRHASYGSQVLDWLSEYRVGWQELFPNAGDACEVMGVPLPFHGEVSMARWEVTEVTDTRAVMHTPSRLPLVLERTMWLDPDRPALRIEERVTNDADVPVPCIWGHHPAFAVTETTVLDIPATQVHIASTMTDDTDLAPGGTGTWPMVPAGDGSIVDLSAPILPRHLQRLSYLPDVIQGWAAVRDPASGIGAGLAWDTAVFPHAWLWQDTGTMGMPFFGRSRLTAIEPNTAWPSDGLARAIERGQAHVVPAGGALETWITAVAFSATNRPVAGITRDGQVREG